MQSSERLHALDSVRAIALVGGVVLHATLSFLPGMPAFLIAPAAEPSRSVALGVLFFAIHVFRMTAFFLIAGFFARMMIEAKGVGGFVRNRLVRIGVPLVAGWPVVTALIVVLWVVAFAAAHPGVALKPPQAPAGHKPLLAFPLTHLWFLWVLLLLYATVIPVRCLIARLDRAGHVRALADAVVQVIVRFPLGVSILALPTCLALVLTPHWVEWFGVPTPDQSLVPPASSFAIFLLAFGFGWLLRRQPELLQVIGRRWAYFLGFAVVLIGLCLMLGGVKPSFQPAEGMAKVIFAARYALAMWMSVFALIGVCVRFLSAPSKTIRFVSDASYWVYLAHLPLVFALQFLASRLALPWEVKFPLILWLAMSLLLVSYRYLVRYSFIGAVLNGRRRRPAKAAIPALAQPA
jgi:peptidoglycan/LPS O-acetylase OafA/YrhL